MAKKKKTQNLKTATPPQKALPAACIIPHLLYLAPVTATAHALFLATANITHILSIGKSPAAHFSTITYTRLGLLDTETADIAPAVEKACSLIDEVEASGGAVLVHCSAAISRSPTIVVAYLMKRRGETLRASLEMLVRGREAVAPNAGFLRQLGAIEREVFGGRATVDVAALEGKTKLKTLLESKMGKGMGKGIEEESANASATVDASSSAGPPSLPIHSTASDARRTSVV